VGKRAGLCAGTSAQAAVQYTVRAVQCTPQQVLPRGSPWAASRQHPSQASVWVSPDKQAAARELAQQQQSHCRWASLWAPHRAALPGAPPAVQRSP
jgi:hypothetical protein